MGDASYPGRGLLGCGAVGRKGKEFSFSGRDCRHKMEEEMVSNGLPSFMGQPFHEPMSPTAPPLQTFQGLPKLPTADML